MKQLLNSRKKRVAAAAISAAMVVGGAGAAFAFFTATGSGSATGLVGQTNNGDGTGNAWTVSVTGDHADADALYPGGNTASLPFTVTNSSPGNLGLHNVTVSVAHDSHGYIETTAGDSTSAVTSCLASWFNVDSTGSSSDAAPALSYLSSPVAPTVASPTDVASAGVVSGTATLKLTDAATSQDSCQGHTPAVIVSAS